MTTDRSTPQGQPSHDLDPLVELAEIAADLRAVAAWEGHRGATLVPAQPPLERPREAAPRPVPTRPGPDLRSARPATRAPAASGPPTVPPQWEAFSSRAPKQQEAGSSVEQGIRAALAGAGDLPGERMAAVREALGDCRRCRLCEQRRQIVFGVGDPAARLAIVGEAPGREEDVRGEPFVGRAGEMLDAMITNVLKLKRSDVFITNVVKCRPPENRNPDADEIAACAPYLAAQLGVVQPDLVLVLGSVAAKALFQTTRGITRLRGEWRALDLPGGAVPAMATFHPAYLLRKPEDKRLTLADLRAVVRRLG